MLVVYVLLLTLIYFPAKAGIPSFWIRICLGGLFANVCFTSGPTLEAYGTHFRIWNGTLTMVLFLLGLAFTVLLATGSVASF